MGGTRVTKENITLFAPERRIHIFSKRSKWIDVVVGVCGGGGGGGAVVASAAAMMKIRSSRDRLYISALPVRLETNTRTWPCDFFTESTTLVPVVVAIMSMLSTRPDLALMGPVAAVVGLGLLRFVARRFSSTDHCHGKVGMCSTLLVHSLNSDGDSL